MTIEAQTAKSTALVTFAEKFPTDQPCGLWAEIQSLKLHDDPSEKRAVARAIVKDILRYQARDYLNAYCHEAEILYSGRPFAAYSISLMRGMPKFAKRASKKRSKTVLGWLHVFLTAAGEAELLERFESAITPGLPN